MTLYDLIDSALNTSQMRFFLSIRGGLDHFIAPFCRSAKCRGHV
jgi:hypothetical protein